MKTLVDTADEGPEEGFETRQQYRWRCGKCGKSTPWHSSEYRADVDRKFHICPPGKGPNRAKEKRRRFPN